LISTVIAGARKMTEKRLEDRDLSEEKLSRTARRMVEEVSCTS